MIKLVLKIKKFIVTITSPELDDVFSMCRHSHLENI